MAEGKSTHRTVKLLLVGITGAGKSATGNSILGRKQFVVGGSATSVTSEVSCGFAEVDDCILHVIDGPGLESTTAKDTVEDKVMAIANVGQALSLCNGYLDAVLLVIKYGERFTKEQKNAVEAVQRIIGTEGMQKFGIVIITKKKKWRRNHSETHPTLEEWCRDQDDKCGNIFSLCKFRALLFENQRNELTQQESQSQRTELLQYVQEMNVNGSYTNEHFIRAENERSKYIAQKKCFIMKETYQREINLLYAEICTISDTEKEDAKLKRYKDIEQRAEALANKIEEDDRGSGSLVELKVTLKRIVEAAVQKNIETLLQLGHKIETLRTKRKGALSHAILSGIATVLTLGIATPLFISKLKKLTLADETIDFNEKTITEYKK